jgi:hypothetical protein
MAINRKKANVGYGISNALQQLSPQPKQVDLCMLFLQRLLLQQYH